MNDDFPNLQENNKTETNEQRIDWSEILHKYETPTVFKDELLRPYFEQVSLEEPIIDVGCGKGYFSHLLCERGYKVSGIDLNSQLQSDEKFDFQKVDFTAIETNRKFNTVLLVNILTTASFSDRLKILKKIKEIKTEEGIAYVVNTNANLFGSELDSESLSIRKVGENKYNLKIKLVDEQYIEFDDYVITQEEMERMCQEAGLQIIERKDLKSKEQDKPIYEVYLLK
ncbi:MAG: methyltransferase domain-containing protein [Candidatus Falkowbacteria bacterium]